MTPLSARHAWTPAHGILAVATLLAGSAAAADDSASTLPAEQARMYACTSSAAWAAARGLLAEVGLKATKLDEKAQFVSVSIRKVKPKSKLPWNDALPPGAQGYELQIFVPAGIEPARVHLSTIVDYEDQARGVGLREFDSPALNRRIFARLEEHLALAGQAIPRDGKARRDLEARLLPQGAPDCAAAPDEPLRWSDGGYGVGVEPPQVIEASQVNPKYPHSDKVAGKQGLVMVDAVILEDGSVAEARLIREGAPGSEIGVAALQAMRMWRFRPARRDGCGVPVHFTMTVNYSLRR